MPAVPRSSPALAHGPLLGLLLGVGLTFGCYPRDLGSFGSSEPDSGALGPARDGAFLDDGGSAGDGGPLDDGGSASDGGPFDDGSSADVTMDATSLGTDGGQLSGDASETRCRQKPTEQERADGFFPAPSEYLLDPGASAAVPWRYSVSPPTSDWVALDYDDSMWRVGQVGFYFGAGRPDDARRTPWPAGSPKLWLRKEITLFGEDLASAVFWARWDDEISIYVNGVHAVSEFAASAGYRYLGMSPEARSALVAGKNTLAVLVTDHGAPRYFDLGITSKPELVDQPRIGFERTPELRAYTDAVSEFMVTHGIPAGALAVMKQDTIAVLRGMGWADKNFCEPLAADAVFRLAGNERWITVGAVRKLLDEEHVDSVTGQPITEDTRVFELFKAHGLEPIEESVPAASVYEITVKDLLAKQSGLAPPPASDQFYAALNIAPGTETPSDNVRWAYSATPLFPPGTAEDASDVSFMVLRYLIEIVKGDVLGYLRNDLFAPILSTGIFIAHERVADRSPREPWYATLEAPYPRWIALENSHALAASAEALVRYLRGYHIITGQRLIDPHTLEWSDVGDNGHHYFNYGSAGTWSFLWQRRYDQVGIAVLFNLSGEYSPLFQKLSDITDTLSLDAWGQ